MTPLTRAQKRVATALQDGGQIWIWTSDPEREIHGDQPLRVGYVLATWYGPNWDDFRTETVQVRTLIELRRRGLLPEEVEIV